MDEFVTLKTFTQYHELSVIRTRLEFEGIETFVPDELTVQSNPLYSNAIGGLRLQVKQSDLETALEILEKSGYHTETKNTRIEDILQRQFKYRIFQKTNPVLLLLALAAIVIGLTVTVMYFFTRSSTKEILLENTWCMESVDYNGKTFIPHTNLMVTLSGPGLCEETFRVRENGSLQLPGFNSGYVQGRWKIEHDSITISSTDTFSFVYDGRYAVSFPKGQMILTSPTTTIYCVSNNYRLTFPF